MTIGLGKAKIHRHLQTEHNHHHQTPTTSLHTSGVKTTLLRVGSSLLLGYTGAWASSIEDTVSERSSVSICAQQGNHRDTVASGFRQCGMLGVTSKHVSRTSGQHSFPTDHPEAVAEDAVASSEPKLSVKSMPPSCTNLLHLGALPSCGNHRPAIAAVSPDGSSNWMAAEELRSLFGGSSISVKAEGISSRSSEGRVSSQKWIAAAYGGAVAFRSFTGPLVLSR